MTNQYPNQQPAPGIPNVNQPAPAQTAPAQTSEVVQERVAPATGSTTVETKKKNNKGWLWWFIPLILVLLLATLAWWIFGDREGNDEEAVETTVTDVIETEVDDELAPAPAPIEGQDPSILETLDPVAPVDPMVPPAADNPEGVVDPDAVAPEAPAPEQAPDVVDPVVPGADEMAPAPAPAQ